MDAENWTTEQIEAYLRQALPAPEQAKLKADLEQDEQLRAEVAAYQRVLEGLDALQEENFRAQLDSWSAETATNDQTALIAWYLEGQLKPEGQQMMEARMAADPAFWEEVMAYQQLIGGMEAAQDEDFRSKLEEWEAGMAQQANSGKALKVVSRRPMWQYAAAAVGALLIAFSTFSLYLKANYSGPALSRVYYESPISERTMGGENAESTPLQERMDFAHRQLIGKEYNAAFMAFDSLMREIPRSNLDDFNKTLLLEQAGWNRLLAATAMDNPPIDLIAEARRIRTTPGHEYAGKAEQLLNDLESRWYRWAN
ncbi:MAG: hypothetical protein RIC19_01830 [Phaeodactylibacter sp.]|uniref:hypothetical protein n=1 Tax=Phaeodactylibacter sp. TaxID=1940289 RepID=UPI0032EE1BD9